MAQLAPRTKTAPVAIRLTSEPNWRCLIVRRRPGMPSLGWLVVGPLRLPCALGRSGIRAGGLKREGDGATPSGRFRCLQAFWRPDQGRRPRTRLSLIPIGARDGWCDASGDRNYNRPVQLPYPASAEAMWRPDRLYNLVIDLDWNRHARRQGRGSAIFLHVAAADFTPTAGCVALRPDDARRLFARIGPRTRLIVKI